MSFKSYITVVPGNQWTGFYMIGNFVMKEINVVLEKK